MKKSYLLILLLFFLSCSGDKDLMDVDADAIPMSPSYKEYVAPIMNRYCVRCHSTSGSQCQNDDEDEGENLNYSSYECVKIQFDDVLEITIEEGEMPPGGAKKLTPQEEAILIQWQKAGYPQ